MKIKPVIDFSLDLIEVDFPFVINFCVCTKKARGVIARLLLLSNRAFINTNSPGQ